MTQTSADAYVDIIETPTDIKRVTELQAFFSKEFNQSPKFIVRVPGRVNLIGEHVDYCGYPVLPMAIEQNILVAVAPSNDCLIHLKNIDEKYKTFKCNINTFRIELPETGGPQWYNYFLCGVKGVLEHGNLGDSLQNGMMIAVSGNVPPASGLSSSSALVSAATLCTTFANNMLLDKQILATISANCERYIGTQGGGMDQAIAFLAKKGCAQFIEWNPLRATSINLPSGAIFVIANSLSEANKAATSDFNQRVVECRLGCRLVAKLLGMEWRDIDRYSTLHKVLNCSLEEIEAYVNKYLTQTSYDRESLIEMFDITEEDFIENLLTANTKNAETFKLRQRGLHVFQESIRVRRFADIAEGKIKGNLGDLSKLMRESHESLKNLFECSHPNLDKLVEISDRLNIGARLTGAGWGGCIVALCDSTESCHKYISELKSLYYKDLPQAKGCNLDEIVFATSPQRGAEIYVNEAYKIL